MAADYYLVLGLDRGATQDEVKKAYKKLALQHHPDHNPGDAASVERFKQVSEAYRVLGDEERRRRYDRFGDVGDGGPVLQEVDVATVAEFFESIFGDVFGRRRQRGKDLRADVQVTFEEAAFGVEKTVVVTRTVPCNGCDGSGAARGATRDRCTACSGKGQVRFEQGPFSFSRTCRSCEGRGWVPSARCETCAGAGTVARDEHVTVRLPPGVEGGSKRTVKGLGSVGPDGPGDLVVHVKVKKHAIFTRKGNDVLATLAISFPQAALGDEVSVPTLDGAVSMKVKPGTQSGQLYKLRGKGIPHLPGARGDQIVRIEVAVPQSLTERQVELIKQLAAELGVDVHPQQRGFLDKLRGVFS